MRFNLLYVLIPIAIGCCAYIMRDLQGQSEHVFFGTAETEPTVLNLDMDVEVQQLFVHTGQEVKAGDTLAILVQRKLDDDRFALSAELSRTDVEHSGSNALLKAQIQKVQADHFAKITELEQEIAIMQTADSVRQALNTRLFPGVQSINQELERKKAAIREAIAQERIQHAHELDRLHTEARVLAANVATKQSVTRQKQTRQSALLSKLVLIAPVSGYIDQLHLQKGASVQAHREMLRIYPTVANRIIGFVHEKADIPFRIGDSVMMTSSTRTQMTAEGKIVAVSPKLVELPMRLRKFIEVRAWGRELVIQPTPNQFYIGEKITIALKAQAQ